MDGGPAGTRRDGVRGGRGVHRDGLVGIRQAATTVASRLRLSSGPYATDGRALSVHSIMWHAPSKRPSSALRTALSLKGDACYARGKSIFRSKHF